jgi:hypothetical protein
MTRPLIPVSQIGGDVQLAKEVQGALAREGYLDPPADGEFGAVSQWALAEFGRRHAAPTADGLTEHLRGLLMNPTKKLPGPKTGNFWVLGVIAYMESQNYWISRHPKSWNIVYVEGMDASGTPNDDRPNWFNDVRLVFQIQEDGGVVSHAWDATTEPGRHWTEAPMSAKGAARIAFGQHKCWMVGKHLAGKPSGHEALTQQKDVDVYRDLDKNYVRTGDKVDRGIFGINQHWGYDHPVSDIGRASAGCLVGRTRDGHREFMKLLKSDARYRVNNGYLFMTTVIDGTKLA